MKQKDIRSDHQGEALKEGCHERERAQMGVSSMEKIDTKGNLTRATVKTLSQILIVTKGHVSQVWRELS